MAFNPFHAFRKHQKVFFAFLTIICMLTFIIQLGVRGADPLDRILQLIGMSRNRGDLVTTLYGKKIYDRNMRELQQQRLLAGGFMTGKSEVYLVTALFELQKELSRPAGRQQPDSLREITDIVDGYFRRMREIQMYREMQRTGIPMQVHRQAVGDLQRIIQAGDAPGLEKDAEQRGRLNLIAEALAFQAWSTSMPMESGRERMYYFGGSSKTADLLDFMIWKHQADQMNIVLSPEEICAEVNRRIGQDKFQADSFSKDKDVTDYLRANVARQGATATDLLNALSDELRVVMAKEALLGKADGVPGWRTEFDLVHFNPASLTPDELLEYFRKQRTTVAVDMLPVSANRFISEVPTPSAEELRSYYETFKDDEWSPERKTPGFKAPRRIRLAWFSFTPKSSFYKKKAAQLAELTPLFRLGAGANTYPAGGGPAAWAMHLSALAFDPRYLAPYEQYQKEEKDSFGNDMGVGLDLKDRRELSRRPEMVAGLAGQLAGASGTGGSLLSAPAYAANTAALHQVKTLQSFGSAVLGAGSGSLGTAISAPLPFTHTTLPPDAVRPQMYERFQESLAQTLIHNNILALGKEMDSIKDKTNDAGKVEQLLREAAGKYGLEDVHIMKGPRSRVELQEKLPEDLEKLKKAYDTSQEARSDLMMRMQMPEEMRRPDFLTLIFKDTGVNTPYWTGLAGTDQNPSSNIDPRVFARTRDLTPMYQLFHQDDRAWILWRIEDKPAHIRRYGEIEDEVVRAWKLSKARRLAHKEAQRILNDLKERKGGAPEDAVRFLRDQAKGEKIIELKDVARLRPISRADFLLGAPRMPKRFKPFEWPADTVEYPSADMLDQILSLREPGEATLVADRPQMHYYVTVLMERVVPEVRELFEIYREPVSRNLGDEPTLWQMAVEDKREAFRRRIIEQLRAEAGEVENGELKIEKDYRKGVESGSDSGE